MGVGVEYRLQPGAGDTGLVTKSDKLLEAAGDVAVVPCDADGVDVAE